MAEGKRDFKTKAIAANARRFPWTRDDARAILTAIEKVESAANELASTCKNLPDSDDADVDGWGVRSRRRMVRNAVECLSEVGDITHAIYSKYPDLAPEELRGHYIA